MLALTLAACGGGGGGSSTTDTSASGGTSGGTSTNTAPAPASVVNASTFSSDQWAALSLTGTITSVTINSPPVVTFQVLDSSGRGISGLAQKGSNGHYSNFAFAIAKLKPADPTTNWPSRWVSYMVVSTPAAGSTAVPGFPETENNGTLVDNNDGTYTYTFALDLKKVQSYVDAATVYDANHVKSDLDDLTYEPSLPHRLIISVGGNQPGTTTSIGTSANISYDFVPATGKTVSTSDPQRVIVDSASCNECHAKLSLHATHFPAIQDTKLCVVCHTEQQKYGSGDAMPTSGKVLVPAGAYASYGATMKLQGRALPNFPNMVHHIHLGEDLYYQGYNQFNVKYNEVKYPQDVRNCTKCHDDSATAAHPTAQGDNWKNVPSRLACGACHDGINFDTGKGVTLADAANGLTSSTYGHVGGIQTDDSKCALCHSAAAIPVYHSTVTMGIAYGSTTPMPYAAQQNPPAGAVKFSYQINSVTVDKTTGYPTVVFKILKNGTPVSFNAQGSTEMLTGFGKTGPTIYIAFAVPEDGITAPADFNASASATVANIWDGTKGTLTGPDSSGNYTAVLKGTTASPITIPANAVIVTAFLGYGAFLQSPGTNGLDANAYPNGLYLPAQDVQMVATGYTARRAVVSTDKCNACHGQLGLFTGKTNFHVGLENDANACAICHNPNLSSHLYDGWTANVDYWVHAIHAAGKRTVPYTELASIGIQFSKIRYPGILKDCAACHLPGTFDFSASASAAAVPNRLYTTAASGTMIAAGSAALSPYVTGGTNYGSGFSYSVATGTTTAAADTTLVISPIATACFACHDTDLDRQHMESNGGSIYRTRGAPDNALAKTEQCMLCHASGKVADIKAMHAK